MRRLNFGSTHIPYKIKTFFELVLFCCCWVIVLSFFLLHRVPGVFVVVFVVVVFPASWISFQEPTLAHTFNNED